MITLSVIATVKPDEKIDGYLWKGKPVLEFGNEISIFRMSPGQLHHLSNVAQRLATEIDAYQPDPILDTLRPEST